MRDPRLTGKTRSAKSLQWLVVGSLAMLLSACGGGGGESEKESNNQRVPDAYKTTQTADQTTTLKGTGDTEGVKTGSIELSWSAPSTRTDGEPLALSEIKGYRIYYGAEEGEYVKGADIKDGSAESVTIVDVPHGEYYVVMTTFDSNGIESDYSAPVMKTVG